MIMVSTRKRGAYYENKAKEHLELMGYEVERALPKTIWIKGKTISLHHDFFGLWDLIAVSPSTILFVQVKYEGVKTNENWQEKRKLMEKFAVPTNCRKEVWHYEVKEGIRNPQLRREVIQDA